MTEMHTLLEARATARELIAPDWLEDAPDFVWFTTTIRKVRTLENFMVALPTPELEGRLTDAHNIILSRLVEWEFSGDPQ